MRLAVRRKERKKLYTMPLHKRKVLLHAALSKELKEKLKKNATHVKKGYKVKIMRGNFKGKEGTVVKVSYKKVRIYVEGITRKNARGREKFVPIHPSNVMIVSLQ